MGGRHHHPGRRVAFGLESVERVILEKRVTDNFALHRNRHNIVAEGTRGPDVYASGDEDEAMVALPRRNTGCDTHI